MVDIITGYTKKPAITDILIEFFNSNLEFKGQLYTGYPILYDSGDNISVDAIWISKEYGILIFDLIQNYDELENCIERQEKIYSLIDGKLRMDPSLKKGRSNFLVNIDIVGFTNITNNVNNDEINIKCNIKDYELLKSYIDNLSKWENNSLFERVLSIIQSVIGLKSKDKRLNVKNKNSKGAKLKELESQLSVLDIKQADTVIGYFDGVQRIRGLAGSGKTIVLALKAAYLHSQNPDLDIAITFHTRSLKKQFESLIMRFCLEKGIGEPDWKKIRIVNAWGGPGDEKNKEGIYYDFCLSNGIEYQNLNKARSFAGYNKNAFEEICRKAVNEVNKPVAKYDIIFVDEAQDLSESFLQLCYKFLKGDRKRLVYAYDEMQKLNEATPLRSPKEFLISQNESFDDKILYMCYRNPRHTLITAHALGLGIYRNNRKGEHELVQFFDQPQLWRDVGYEVESGTMESGQDVTLIRTEESSPRYFEQIFTENDLMVFKTFDDKISQFKWAANEIEKNLKEDELKHTDIIIINPDPLTTKNEWAQLMQILSSKKIKSHIAGNSDADVFLIDDSIAFTGIYRAKGNEAPMVYIINAQECYSGNYSERDLIRVRNILFTAITRSKSWVRVLGYGKEMEDLIKEYESVKNNNYKLKFRYPSVDEIKRLNTIHRDITDSDKVQFERLSGFLKDLNKIVANIKKGNDYIESYPEEMRKIIKLYLQ